MGEKISIITISYNSERTIEKTMKSVLEQSYRPLEYVLVDGNSKDDTIRLIESYIPQFEKAGIEVVFHSEPDKGISDAFNKGINRATGDIIGITNTDDAILPDTLQYVADNFPTDVDVFYGNILWEDTVRNINYVRKSSADLSDLKFKLKALHPAVYIRETLKNSTFSSTNHPRG
ncbi:MAG: glycosyltransferase, partial [Lachnospiraceae bacterium]|nr:glycosyltransferase [Lachnospiraceae bacterium]